MRLPALLLLLPCLAAAQTQNIVRPLVGSRGVTLPPDSTAIVDEATALSLNPGSLRFVDDPQVFFIHERNRLQDQVGNGLFAGTSMLGVVGLGFGLEWLNNRTEPDYRRTSFGFSLGTDTLALGATYHAFGSADESIEKLSTWDIGLSARPWREFSYSVVARDINQPEQGEYKLTRSFDVGVGLRPFGERYTLGVDYQFRSGGLDEGRFSYALKAEVLPGLRVGAGMSHGLREGEALAFQLGLTLDTSHFGVTYAPGGTNDGLDHVLAVRLSSSTYRSVVSSGVVTMVDLNDRLSGGVSPALALFGASGPDPYLRLMRFLDLASRDPQLRGVVLKMEGLGGADWGRAEELRQAVLRLRASGKKVMAVLLSCDDRCYLVASAADQIYTVPASSLIINGLSASVTTFGGTMEKLGVSWDVARVGQYKTAPEQLTLQQMSEAQREQVSAYLDTEVAWYEEAVTRGRRLPAGRLREVWATGIIPAAKAQQLGLVDGLLPLQSDLEQKVREMAPTATYSPTYSPRAERETRWARRRRIAIVPVLGSIAGGKSREDPFGGARIAGAETVVLALQRAQEDPSVVAIVLRVDSGGGDVLASDLMYRAVLEARKHKPVIASMGDVAASGGYYVSMGANEIFANPTTITGSIGVFYLKPALQGLLGDKLGINREKISRSPLADMFDPWRTWTPEEQTAVQAWVDATYDDFITYVSQERKLDKAQVDAVARGRVWSGKDAHARRLVDKLGGLMDAVDAARTRAKVDPGEEIDLEVYGEPRGLFSSLGGEPSVMARLLPEAQPALLPGMQALVKETGLSATWVEPGLKAAMPFTLTIE
ncbi:signal peptide peptidase SppA [Hyalangium gracile]|uniref:signal peptide peptidase SppA n=1 Tax=Hyalangium gracile TaxID=394092 RepID=UPI001CCB3E00|nr:signal peptide peptidase SppA [Hyalangium gracile]